MFGFKVIFDLINELLSKFVMGSSLASRWNTELTEGLDILFKHVDTRSLAIEGFVCVPCLASLLIQGFNE